MEDSNPPYFNAVRTLFAFASRVGDLSEAEKRHADVVRSLPDVETVAPLENIPVTPVAQENPYSGKSPYSGTAVYSNLLFGPPIGHHLNRAPVVTYSSGVVIYSYGYVSRGDDRYERDAYSYVHDTALEYHTERNATMYINSLVEQCQNSIGCSDTFILS